MFDASINRRLLSSEMLRRYVIGIVNEYEIISLICHKRRVTTDATVARARSLTTLHDDRLVD